MSTQIEKKENAPAENKDTSGISDKTIAGIAGVVNGLSEGFGRSYERLNYPGFVSVLGAVLVFSPLVLGRLAFAVPEPRLYVVAGVLFVLFAACWISIQNVLIYKLQKVKQENACKMLAIRVAAMGETQRAALATIGETTADRVPEVSFKDR
jgi:uncharacterized membrane protein